MTLRADETHLDGMRVLSPRLFPDDRGYLAETYHREKYRQLGVTCDFVQDNQSFSKQGVLRGLHAQLKHPQAKLVRALTGEIFDVAVDIRVGSATFGRWYAEILTGENLKQLFIPEGFLHGFVVLSETALVHYKCSDLYYPDDQCGVLWNDPELGIQWPDVAPILSEKDRNNIPWSKLKETLAKGSAR
jgi:dTDP-4-dehydrorhamnose 3,5-epimerase